MEQQDRDQIEQAAQDAADGLGLPYFDTRPHIDIKPLVGKLTVMGMQAYGIVPVQIEGKKLTIATSEETDRTQLDSLRARLAGYDVTFVYVSQLGWDQL